MFQAIDAGGEYEVPQCKPGTSPEECVHTISQDFTVASTVTNEGVTPSPVDLDPHTSQVLLLRAGTHCHAPSCINETLYNLDTGEVICYNAPLYGQGEWPQSGQHFDEQEYAAGVPPCFWGSEEEGLPPPPRLNLTTRLRSVKHCNNTYYHLGVRIETVFMTLALFTTCFCLSHVLTNALRSRSWPSGRCEECGRRRNEWY